MLLHKTEQKTAKECSGFSGLFDIDTSSMQLIKAATDIELWGIGVKVILHSVPLHVPAVVKPWG